jgi:hypothetical protein
VQLYLIFSAKAAPQGSLAVNTLSKRWNLDQYTPQLKLGEYMLLSNGGYIPSNQEKYISRGGAHGLKQLDSGQAGGGKCSVETAITLQQMKALALIMDSTLNCNACARLSILKLH